MVQSRRSGWALLLGALLLVSGGAWAQRGALTTSRGLDQLTQEAQTIVRGYVTSAKVERDPELRNLTTVLISMNVEETLKGSPQKTLQFRQYIWDMRDQLDAARYAKGEELLLMLGPVSPYGLTSPVGLDQGRFRISRDNKGQAMAVNGRGNLRLFEATEQRARARGMKLSPRVTTLVRQSQTKAGPLPLADLEDTIRAFVGTK
ncbi:MAG TPA: hypothetical protein VFQ00_07220 [Terriglobales bacterium]|nr:hypothetical protein [Terriglobales bacterium]